MYVEHHPLISEFPDHRDLIHDLKMSHQHFSRLADEYENVDKTISRIENGVEHSGDVYLEDLKKQRLLLKDQLYSMLKEHGQS